MQDSATSWAYISQALQEARLDFLTLKKNSEIGGWVTRLRIKNWDNYYISFESAIISLSENTRN